MTNATTRRGARRLGALGVYLLIAVAYTWPLLPQSGTRIAGNAGDPILTTSILWWNATTLPFSAQWWNLPFYYPDHGVLAFSETLLGISPFASPIYWITHNPLTAYNVSLYLAWPLSAFGVYLLTLTLTRREDAAFIAGLIFGFTPYRAAELGHIQMVSSYWLPLAFLALHRYLDDRRVRWLGLFGLGYLLQSLANGYMVFYGAVLIGLWLLYFGSTRASWRAIPPILGAWGVAALPLVPILAKYRAIHNEYDMHRVLDQPLGYSAPANAWAQVSQVVWFWHHLLPDSDHNLFPGAVALVLVCAAFVAWLRPRGPAPASAVARRRKLRFVFLLIGGVALAAAAYTFVVGPWHIALGIRQLRMTNTGRSLIVATACIAGLIWLSRRARDAINRRSLWLFYVAAAIVMAIFSSGPVLSVGYRAVLDPAPYSWLMALPGFNELRVPTRFWMLGVMCLGVGAGLSFARLVPASSNRRTLTTLVVSAAVLVESWMVSIPMAAAPTVWPVVEPASVGRPILELPIGPYFDTAAAFRSIAHRRPVFNGASGYEPQHYLPLQEGLTNHDPTMLPAIATLGSFDVVVNSEDDSGGTWTRYVLSTPGVEQIATAGGRTSYRVPAAPLRPPLGAMIPIVRVEALDTDPAGMDPLAMIDGRVDTEWRTIPQKPGHSVVADLGAVRNVGGVSQGLGGAARDFPRGLAIDVSTDGARWEEVWAGSPVGEAFRAAVEAPLEATIEFTFPPRPARFVRLRLTASHPNFWRIVELHVHAPSGAITPSRGARTPAPASR